MFRYIIIVLSLCCSGMAVNAQTGNRVFNGAEATNFSSIDLSTPGGQSWSTDRTATPGYFSAVGIAAYTSPADNYANINGYVKHYADATNQAFTYPVGTGLDLRTLSISGTIPATAIIAVAWIPGDPTTTSDPTTPNAGNHAVTSFGPGLEAISPVGQWDWQDLGGNAAGVMVTVSIPDMMAFAPAGKLRLVGWNGLQWVDLSVTQGAAAASGNTENSTLTGTMIPGISAIAIGKTSLVSRPDINAGNINKVIAGNTATNDRLPPGTTYGVPGSPVLAPAGSTPIITMNANGTYQFQANLPGVYEYSIPVCAMAQAGPCTPERLRLTITDPGLNTNLPFVHDDYTQTQTGVPVNITVKGNDAVGNDPATLGSPGITVLPVHGTAVVNTNGTITYTPEAGYTGTDTFAYLLCEMPGALCASARVAIHVVPPGMPNNVIASDDLSVGYQGQTQTGNVLGNDTDPQGQDNDINLLDLNGDGIPETQASGTAQTLTQNGTAVGTFTINGETGAYTFIPQAGFTGTVNLAYQVVDDLSATDRATLILVVNNSADLATSFVILPAQAIGNDATLGVRVTVRETQQMATHGNIHVLVPVSSHYTLNTYDPAMVLINGLPVQNANWSYLGIVGSNHIFKYGGSNNASVIAGNGVSRFGFYIVYSANTSAGSENVGITIFNGSGGERNFQNNSDYESVNYSTPN